MKECSAPRPVAVIVAAICVALLAGSALAQFQTGNIYGRVEAKDGSILPGVTVTLTGIGAPQTTVTDSQGLFRFINLSPGVYSLKAELTGYGTATRSGIGVRIAQNSDITITLNPSMAESITVTAEAPILDVRKTGTGISVAKVELEKVPTGRDPWVIMQQTPGVLLDRINVGGNQSGQQSGYVSKGARSGQSSWNVDGVTITDFAATGSTPTYYDFDSFEEMQITTGGADPRIKTPGIQMNMVTKRGTNDFKGSGRWFQTNDSWQAKPTIPAEAQSYLTFVNQIQRIEDRGAELGGPIMKDKVWVWGAFSRQNVNLLTASIIAGKRFTDKTLLQNENLKLNGQLLPSNSLVVTDMYGEKVKLGRNVSPQRPPETAWNQGDEFRGGKAGNLFNPTMWKFEDTQIFGSSLYLTGVYSEVQGGFHLISDNGQGCRTFTCGVSGAVAYLDSAGDAAWHRSYLSYATQRPQNQARIDGSKFFDIGKVNHELKFGFGYRNANVQSRTAWPGAQNTTTGPVSVASDTGAVTLNRDTSTSYFGKYQDLYIGDTILLGALTVQASLRYDVQKGGSNGGTQPANPTVPDLLPAVSWNRVSGLKWTNVSPRVGLTYALGATRRTLLRAGYNRYVDQMGSTAADAADPGGVYPFLYYYFKDLNGDHVAQRNEIDFDHGLVNSGGVDPKNPGAPFQQFQRWASNLKAPRTDELILGFETELLPDFSVGINGTYRNSKDFLQFVGEHHKGQGDYYTPADYVLAPTPATATLPDGTKVTLPYYILAPGVSKPVYTVLRNRPNYSERYKSADLYATKRLSNRWMLRGNVTLSDWTRHVGSGAIVDPTVIRLCDVCNGTQVVVGSGSGSGAFGGVYINSKWAYNVTGTYQIPVIETSFGINLSGRQGYPIPYVYRITAPRGEGTKNLQATSSPTQLRHPNVSELDLRLAKDIRIWRGGVTLSVDAFNVLNKQTVLQRDVRRLQLSSSNRITELMSPRVFRLGLRTSF